MMLILQIAGGIIAGFFGLMIIAAIMQSDKPGEGLFTLACAGLALYVIFGT